MHLWEIFLAGGHVMWVLLACSIFAVMVGIQRIHYFTRVGISKAEESELTELLRNKEWGDALAASQNNPSSMSQALVRSLRISEPKLREVTYEGAATTLIHRMGEGLQYLDTIVTLSPLLGLLGTVLGMIQSFQVLAVKEGQMDVITGGVAEALIATAFGLIVAVLALCFHSYLSFRMERIATTLEEWGNLLQDTSEYRL